MDRMLLPPLALALTLTGLTAIANISDKIVVQTAPPPPPHAEESTPHPRAGFVWAPGYYTYADSKYVWSKGHWVAERKGYRYVAPRWAQEDGRWTLYPENWVRNEDDKEKTASKDSSLPAIR